jgi:hypothetical protein
LILEAPRLGSRAEKEVKEEEEKEEEEGVGAKLAGGLWEKTSIEEEGRRD